MNWRDFWNQDTPIYVSERHKVLHYRLIANDIAGLVPAKDAVVLDYGCGEALSATRAASRCARLYLVDAAPLVRDRLHERFESDPQITVLAPESMDSIPDTGIDLIVANSLVQYLSFDELRSLLALWRSKLKTDGRLVLGDVVPPDVGPLEDARALLSFAWKGGFLRHALVGLVRTALSDYRRVRNELGLSQYAESEMLQILRETGFNAERRRPNIGHNQARMSFMARRA
jgi:cyclopropane fatty-acyl-phospholipid synthase-like methyltransferase